MMNILEYAIPLKSCISNTLAEYRRFYQRSETWPDWCYNAIGLPFSFKEYSDLVEKAMQFSEKDLGFKCKKTIFVGSAPPAEPDYGSIVRGSGFDAFTTSYSAYSNAQHEWAINRPTVEELTEEIWRTSPHIAVRIMKDPDEPGGLIWWITKRNPRRIALHFYEYENGGNKKMMNKFLKPSLRYYLTGD